MPAFLRTAHKLISFSIVLSSIAASLISAQDQKTFRVDSYIPQRFEDLEWRVDGNTSLSSYANSQEFFGGGSWNGYSYKNGRISLSSSGSYRFKAWHRDLYVQLGASLGLNYSASKQFDSTVGDFGKTEYARDEVDNWSHSFQGSGRIDFLEYLSRDAFLYLTTDQRVRFDQTLDGAEDREQFRIWRSSFGDVSEVLRITDRTMFNRSRGYHGELSSGCGLGRLNEGRFAAIALELVQELREQGKLRRAPDYDEMSKITDLVYNYYNVSTPDSRLTRIEYLSSILAYLEEKGVVDSIDATVPYVLEDVIIYFPRYNRPFGARVRFGVGIDWTYERDFSESLASVWERVVSFNVDSMEVQDTTLSKWQDRTGGTSARNLIEPNFSLLGEIGYPLSRRWQFNASLLGKLYFSKSGDVPGLSSEYSDDYFLSCTATVLYIFSTRTVGRFTVYSSFESFDEQRRVLDPVYDYYLAGSDGRQHESRLEVDGNLTYRITVPTQLSINASYSWIDRRIAGNYGESSNSSLQISANLSHFIY